MSGFCLNDPKRLVPGDRLRWTGFTRGASDTAIIKKRKDDDTGWWCYVGGGARAEAASSPTLCDTLPLPCGS